MTPPMPPGPPRAQSETMRQLVHISMVAFAGLLRFLSWPEAAAMAAAALLFNGFLLGRLAPGIIRAADAAGHRAGVLFYPLSVLLLILAFRTRLDIAAAAWAVMACGDGAATLVGMRMGGPRLPWNQDKTWSGLVAFAVAGSVGAVTLSAWVAPAVRPEPMWAFTWLAPIAAALVAALVETIPVNLDDNLSVPFAAGLVLLLADQVDPRHVSDLWPVLAARLPWALAVNAAMAAAAWWRGALTPTGSLVGTALGVVIFVGAGAGGWGILLMAFVAAVATSRIGHARKSARGIAEARDGRRGAGNALANCVVGAIGAWLMAVGGHAASGALVLVAGLVAGASDTVASEIGKAYGGTTRVFPSFQEAPPGTPGAVSLVGTIAGLVAAAGMAWASSLLLPGGVGMIAAVTAGATVGAFVESALAARFEAPGILNNDALNFINTAVAAVVAAAVARAMAGPVGMP